LASSQESKNVGGEFVGLKLLYPERHAARGIKPRARTRPLIGADQPRFDGLLCIESEGEESIRNGGEVSEEELLG
jgi:hypothetical protein